MNAKNAANRLVDVGHGHYAGLYEIRQMIVVEAADHIHVDAAEKSAAGRAFTVERDVMADEFLDGSPIAVHDALEAPFLAENLL